MAQARRSVVITGFGPFPGAPFNPTPGLVAALARRRRPAFEDLARIAHVFRTSYATVDTELPRLLEAYRPDVLLMFGLAARTPFLRVETQARNTRSVLFSDATGARPAGRGAIARGVPARCGRAPFPALLTALRCARLPARLSRNAGRYLCNFVYWRALATDDPPVVLFVHVPLTARKAVKRGSRRRRQLSATDLARAGEVLLLHLAAQARRPRRSARPDS